MSDITIVSGNKGGSGKSMAAAVRVDRLLAMDRPVALLEGDEGQPDLALRYIHCPGVTLGAVNLNRAGDSEAAVAAFGEWLEQQRTDVVVNLPAGAGDTLDALAEVIVRVCSDLGHAVRVLYALGMHRPASDDLRKSLASGLMGAVPPEQRLVLFPEFLGKVASFDWYRSLDRDTYLAAGGQETTMPALRPEALRDKVLALPGPFSGMLTPEGGLTLTERVMFQRWLARAHAALETAAVNTAGTP